MSSKWKWVNTIMYLFTLVYLIHLVYRQTSSYATHVESYVVQKDDKASFSVVDMIKMSL